MSMSLAINPSTSSSISVHPSSHIQSENSDDSDQEPGMSDVVKTNRGENNSAIRHNILKQKYKILKTEFNAIKIANTTLVRNNRLLASENGELKTQNKELSKKVRKLEKENRKLQVKMDSFEVRMLRLEGRTPSSANPPPYENALSLQIEGQPRQAAAPIAINAQNNGNVSPPAVANIPLPTPTPAAPSLVLPQSQSPSLAVNSSPIQSQISVNPTPIPNTSSFSSSFHSPPVSAQSSHSSSFSSSQSVSVQSQLSIPPQSQSPPPANFNSSSSSNNAVSPPAISPSQNQNVMNIVNNQPDRPAFRGINCDDDFVPIVLGFIPVIGQGIIALHFVNRMQDYMEYRRSQR